MILGLTGAPPPDRLDVTVRLLLDGAVEGRVEVHPGRLVVTGAEPGPLVTLVVGLRGSGVGVAGGTHLPTGPGLPGPAAYRVPFEDHLPAAHRTPEIPWDHLEFRDDLVPTTARWVLEDEQPRAARTWGEVAVNHGWFDGRVDGALAVLPEELIVAAHGGLHRYTVADRATLEHREVITFGRGPSRLLSPSSWRSLAARAGELGHHAVAAACAQEAGDAAEVAYWQAWADWTTADRPASAPREVPVRPWSALLAACGPAYAAGLGRVRDEVVRARAEAEDHRRPADAVPPLAFEEGGVRLGFPLVTGAELVAAGVSPQALAHLGHAADPVPPHARYDDLATVALGEEELWVSLTTAVAVRRSDPAVAYWVGHDRVG